MDIFKDLIRKIFSPNHPMTQVYHHEEFHVNENYFLPHHRSEPIVNEPEMISEVILEDRENNTVRLTPSSTSSSILRDYMNFCGTTIHSSHETTSEKNIDPKIRDERPLKHYLMKRFPWILDVTSVEVHWPHGKPIEKGSILLGPLNIHITVSPQHHTELMSPWIEKKVKDHLCKDILPVLTCMYGNNHGKSPRIIFSPVPSETILEYCK